MCGGEQTGKYAGCGCDCWKARRFGKHKPVKKPPRARPLAIIVTKNEENFPQLLKTIRQTVNPAVTGNAITKMCKTTNGKLLVEINGGAGGAETVREEVRRSLDPTAKVWRMTDESPIEVRDLNDETTSEEVLGAISVQTGDSAARLVSLRRVYGSAKTAVVILPSAAAKRLYTVGRLRVGLVYTRVRHTKFPSRCFRCMAFGHQARDCTEGTGSASAGSVETGATLAGNAPRAPTCNQPLRSPS